MYVSLIRQHCHIKTIYAHTIGFSQIRSASIERTVIYRNGDRVCLAILSIGRFFLFKKKKRKKKRCACDREERFFFLREYFVYIFIFREFFMIKGGILFEFIFVFVHKVHK